MSNLLQFDAAVEIQAAVGDGAKQPRVSILAYAGGLMSVGGWGMVCIDLKGLELPAAAMPLLIDHNANIDGIAGSGTPSISNGRLGVAGHLAPTSDAAQKLIALSKAGVAFGASVGVEPVKHEYIQAGQSVAVNGRTITSDRDFVLVRAGKLREVSILSVPADSSTSVSIAASLHLKGKQRMSEELFNGQTAAEINAEMKAALPENNPNLTMMERVESRWNRTRWHDTAGGPRSRAQRAMISAAAGKIDYQQFENELLQAQLADTELKLMQTKLPQGPMVHASSRDLGGEPRDIISAAFLIRAGYERVGEKTLGERVMQRGRDVQAKTIMDIMRLSLQSAGLDIPTSQDAMIRAGASTAIFTNGLLDSIQKVASAMFSEAPQTWRSYASRRSVPNFLSTKAMRLNNMGQLEELPPDGEIHHSYLTDGGISFKVNTFAKILALTRTDIVNDNASLFDQLPVSFARMAARKLNDILYAALLGNAGSHFSTGNKNLITNALSIVGLSEAVKKMRNQVDANGNSMDLVPKVLLVSPSLETTARQVLSSTLVTRDQSEDQQPSGNPLSNLNLTLEVEPRLENTSFTGNSSTQWYLLCGPQDSPMIAAFLDGRENPVVETSDSDFNQLGIQIRVYHDFGAALGETVAAVKSTGAGG